MTQRMVREGLSEEVRFEAHKEEDSRLASDSQILR